MTKRRLTPQEEEKFKEYVARWRKLGMSTDDVDKPRGEAAVKLAYECADLKEPSTFVHLESPIQGAYAYAVLKKLDAE